MLVLSRKLKEVVSLPDLGIEFRILGVKGTTVKIGIVAPKECKIVRKELLDRDSKESN